MQFEINGLPARWIRSEDERAFVLVRPQDKQGGSGPSRGQEPPDPMLTVGKEARVWSEFLTKETHAVTDSDTKL